jgi:hypothetical protein
VQLINGIPGGESVYAGSEGSEVKGVSLLKFIPRWVLYIKDNGGG